MMTPPASNSEPMSRLSPDVSPSQGGPAPDSTRRVWLLGALRVEEAQRTIRISRGNAQSLFAFLVLHSGTPHPREVLADRLWPDVPSHRVRRKLSDVLYRLQRALGSNWLTVEEDHIGLRIAPDLWVDAWEFERLCATSDLASLQQAVALYGGELLPEVYDDWVLPRRVLLSEKHLTCLLRLGQMAEAQQQPNLAYEYYQRLIDADPLREEAHRGLLRSLADLGRLPDAVAAYTRLEGMLDAELGVPPSTETRRLAEELRSELELSRQLAAYQRDRLTHPPFVGRKRERAVLLEAVEATIAGKGGLFAVEGEAGIGKSRLLEEIEVGARWRGATVVRGGGSERPAASPFTPLSDALAATLAGPRAAQLETLLPTNTLAACAPLHAPWQGMTELPKLPPAQARLRFYHAVAEVCQTLSTLAPHVLILDDLHWTDPAFWETLDGLLPILDRRRLLILLAYRRPEIEQNQGWKTLQKWEREGRLPFLSLGPLEEQDVKELLPFGMQGEAGHVLAESGGNPFFITEMLMALAEGHSPQRSTAVTRAAALPALARTALETAAVLGSEVPYQLWVAASDLPPRALAHAGEQLAAHRLLEPSGTGYAFAHDLIHAAIYESIAPERRQHLHLQASAALAAVDPDNLRARAFHLDRAGADSEAAAIYRELGTKDAARFAFSEAQTAFDRALALMPEAPSYARVETLLALATVCDTTGDRTRQGEALEEALQGARTLEEESLLIQVLSQAGDFAAKTGDHEKALTHLVGALRLAEQIDDQERQIDILLFLGDFLIRCGQPAAAKSDFESALAMAREREMREQEARALDGLGYMTVQLRDDDPEQAIGYFEQALAVQRASGDRLGESRTLSNLLVAFQNLGAWDRLLAMADQVLDAQRAVGYRLGEATTRQSQGLAAYALGDLKSARRFITLAREGFEEVQDALGVGIATDVLGLIAEWEGKLEEATSHFQEALEVAEMTGSTTFAAYAQQDLGCLWVNNDREAAAIPLLESAVVTWQRMEDRLNELKCEAALGLAYLAMGQRSRAEELADKGWAAFGRGVPGGEEPQAWLWTLYRLLTALQRTQAAGEVLRAAYEELGRQGRALEDHEMRRCFFHRVPLNRGIVKAYDELTRRARQVRVTLAHKDAPLGRPLAEAEQVAVRWTVHAPEDEAITGKAERRRHALRRLLAEAEAQEAAPTDEDLAKALGVSRRTILRDMERLAEAAVPLPTRRRR